MPKKDQVNLIEAADAVSKQKQTAQIKAFATAFDNRSAHETLMNKGGTSIQDKLKSVRQRFETPGVAALTVAANVSPDFINRSVSGDKRFNVYAIQKMADILQGLRTGHVKNQVNKAIVASMFACEKAKQPFTGHLALASVSSSIKVKEKGVASILTRHTVAESTAATQASSTLNALEVLGAVKNTGTTRAPIWTLQPGPVTERLREIAA